LNSGKLSRDIFEKVNFLLNAQKEYLFCPRTGPICPNNPKQNYFLVHNIGANLAKIRQKIKTFGTYNYLGFELKNLKK
tara:strand:- start:184 stop:417 length:234 start_codon:yes stop_codon:yes gene_type:complete